MKLLRLDVRHEPSSPSPNAAIPKTYAAMYAPASTNTPPNVRKNEGISSAVSAK